MDNISEILKIVRFFLKLYQLHIGASKTDPGIFKRIGERIGQTGHEHTYELRAKVKGNWRTRRITVGSIGDESGSRSKCFKVTYGDLLVIKLPPVPIKSLGEYIENLRPSRRIAEHLSPHLVCITPEVSAILRETPFFSAMSGLSPAQFEDECLKWLQSHTEFQDYIKIDGKFVFFMNLSKFFFLGQVIHQLHDTRQLLHREIASQAELIWDMQRFQERYGGKSMSTCLGMNAVFSTYEQKAAALCSDQGALSVPLYKLKEWFTTHLNDEKIGAQSDFDGHLPEALNDLFEEIRKTNASVLESYRQTAEQHVIRKNLARNKSSVENLVINLLDMLARLKICAISIRDLKPDNLFVVGDANRYPQFLAKASDFSIGLIDFETAVNFKPAGRERLEQPMLGGTPSYATPSNFAGNEVLQQVFGDTSRVFHLQDWHATVAMIYTVVTGKSLFERTRRLLPQIVRDLRLSLQEPERLREVFKEGSRLFWHTAATEFRTKSATRKGLLKSVHVDLPANVRKMFQQEMFRERARLAERILALVQSQAIFKSKTSHERLIGSPLEKVRRYRRDWENQHNVPPAKPQVRAQVIEFLCGLEHLKQRSRQVVRMVKTLGQPNTAITAQEVLEIMFTTVYKTMYPKVWQDAQTPLPQVPANESEGDTGYEATI